MRVDTIALGIQQILFETEDDAMIYIKKQVEKNGLARFATYAIGKWESQKMVHIQKKNDETYR